MIQLLFGSLLLSVIHAAIPNHWLPIVALAKAEKWNQRETLVVTGISGLAHTLSTTLLGIAVGIIGINLSRSYTSFAEKIAPALLIIRHYNHMHSHDVNENVRSRAKWAIIASLALTMFLSPCLEIEAYYLQAASAGWEGIIMVTFVYILVTVGGMMLLVFLAGKGVQSIRSHFLSHYEKVLTGSVLILLGIISFFVRV
jgi:putative Mn2+ efflux pump MntP